MKTQRLTVLISPQEKAAIAKRAAQLNIPVGEFIRRAASAYDSNQDSQELVLLADELAKVATSANAQLDRALGKSNAFLAEWQHK